LGICILLSLSAIGQAQSAPKKNARQLSADNAPMAIQPMPPAAGQLASTLHAKLKKSAASWIDQQAAIEAQSKSTDLDALRGAVRARFAKSLKPATRQVSTSGINFADLDVEAVVFIVLSEAAQQQENDLTEAMQQMDQINRQKAAMRQLLDELQQAASGAKSKQRDKECNTSFCKSLPSRALAVAGMSVHGETPLVTRVPQKMTYAGLDALQVQMNHDLDSMNDMSEMTSMRLQMAMDRRSKFIETLSNVMKSISDTDSSIVANLK
jgi:hypothetical protein